MKIKHNFLLTLTFIFILIVSMGCASSSDDDAGSNSSSAITDTSTDTSTDTDEIRDTNGNGIEDSKVGLTIWKLDGVEVVREEGSEFDLDYSSGSDYILLPYWDTHFSMQNMDKVTTTGRIDLIKCEDWDRNDPPFTMSFNTGGARLDLDAVLDDLPERWNDVSYGSCIQDGDEDIIWVQFDEVGERFRGTVHVTLIGKDERDGETLVVDGTFDTLGMIENK